MKFSICLIARNEEKTLPRLLDSLKEYQEKGGKVIVLDTGSTDKTVEVARSLGCEVTEVGDKFMRTIDAKLADDINKKFIVENEPAVVKEGDTFFDFGAARNYLATLSPTEHISMPDADEIYTALDLDRIEKAIDEGFEQMKYNFVYSHDAFGNEALKFEHCKFYDRRKLHWVGLVHEVLMPIEGQGQPKSIFLEENIIKLEHFQNHETDRSNYLIGLAVDCFEKPDNQRNSHYFGREMAWLGRPKSAIRELERHVRMNGWAPERSKSMMLIAKCWLQLNFEGTALDWYFRAFMADSTRREPLLALADHFYHKKDAQKAACFANAALEISESLAYWDDRSYNEFKPHEILYWAQWYLGDKMGAKFHYKRALQLQPDNEKLKADAQFFEDDEGEAPITFEYAENGIDGWMTIQELNWLYKTSQVHEKIVEVGSWKGRSTHALLNGNKGSVTAVDTWKGSADPKDGTHGQDTFDEFMTNCGAFNNLKTLRMPSVESAKSFDDKSIDMVFIDAGHTYEELKEDIAAWLPKTKAIICGHDYSEVWPGVMQAVDEAFGKPDGVEDTIWWKVVGDVE